MATRPKPTDTTGVARAKALKENADEVKRRQDEITTAAALEAKRLETEVFDPKDPVPTKVVDEVVDVGVSMADDSVVIRTVADIEDMTYGQGTNYNFKAGVKYKVSKDLALHLENLGYVYGI